MPFMNSHFSIGRVEFRHHWRYPVPPLGDPDLALAVGDGVEGHLHMVEMSRSCTVVAEIIWTRSERGIVGATLTAPAPEAVERLDCNMAHRPNRSRR